MKHATAVAFATAILSFAPAGAEERTIDPPGAFNGVHASRGVKVHLTMGDAAMIVAESTGDGLSRLEIKIDDGALLVRRAGLVNSGDSPSIEVRIVADQPLSSLKATTGAVLEGESLALGDVEIEADTGGVLSVSGTCGAVKAEADTGGVVDARALACRTADARAGTGGVIDVSASEAAKGRARMGGAVTVYGDPPRTDFGTFLGGVADLAD